MVLRSWGLTMVLLEKLKPDHAVEDLRLNTAGRQLSLPLGHRELSFSTVAAAVKFFGSRPVKMN